MKVLTGIAAILLLGTNLVAQTADQPSDMKQCLEQIMSSGMSEGARQSLQHIAGMRIGGSSWVFEKDEASGSYWTKYTSNRCKLPNENLEEAERERMNYMYKLDTEVSRLKCLADFDDSGFVSTDEGFRFRRLVEFGYKAAFVAKEENWDKGKVCAGLQVDLGSADEGVLDQKVKEYATLREKAEKNGIDDLPEVVLR